MIGFFISLSGLFSAFTAPLSAAVSVGGAIASARAQQVAAERAMRAATPKVVDGQPHIPRVKRNLDQPKPKG